MSDQAQGPDWWQAADGRWYPPEQRPGPDVPPPGQAAWPSPDPYGAPGAGGPGAGGPGAGGPGAGEKGFFGGLYDFSFDTFVTPKLIRFFYGFFVVVLTVAAVVFFLSGLASGEAGAVVASLIVVPVLYLVYLIGLRIWFELVAALFRIADDLRAIRRGKGV